MVVDIGGGQLVPLGHLMQQQQPQVPSSSDEEDFWESDGHWDSTEGDGEGEGEAGGEGEGGEGDSKKEEE